MSTTSKDGYWEKFLGQRQDTPAIVINTGHGHFFEIQHYAHGYELHHHKPKQAMPNKPPPPAGETTCKKTYHSTALSAAMKAADLEMQHIKAAGHAATVSAVISKEMEKTRVAIVKAMSLEHMPEEANTEQPCANVPEMLPKAEGKPYESWIAAGWTDKQLIDNGYMRGPM